jgi:hypothetical protein
MIPYYQGLLKVKKRYVELHIRLRFWFVLTLKMTGNEGVEGKYQGSLPNKLNCHEHIVLKLFLVNDPQTSWISVNFIICCNIFSLHFLCIVFHVIFFSQLVMRSECILTYILTYSEPTKWSGGSYFCQGNSREFWIDFWVGALCSGTHRHLPLTTHYSYLSYFLLAPFGSCVWWLTLWLFGF